MSNTQATTVQLQTLDPTALRRTWFSINPDRTQISVAAMTQEGFTCTCVENSNCFHRQQFRLWMERQSIQQLRREEVQRQQSSPAAVVPTPSQPTTPSEAVLAGDGTSSTEAVTPSPAKSGPQKKQSTLFAIIRRALKSKENCAGVLDSLKLLQVMKMDGTVKRNLQTGEYTGSDFRIVPFRDRIVEVQTGHNGNVEHYPFRQIASLMQETRSIAEELRTHKDSSVSIRGLVSIDLTINDSKAVLAGVIENSSGEKPAAQKRFRIIGKNIYLLGKRGGMSPVKGDELQPLFKSLHIPSPCVCGNSHYLWGMEIEFDAYNYTKLTSAKVEASIPFFPVGRDGGGQGEVRSVPHNDFAKTAKSALENYRKALAIVAESKNEMEKVVFLVKQLKQQVKTCKNLSIEGWGDMLPILHEEKSPNGIHIHGPSSKYLEKALDIVAIWWNQHSPQAKAMLRNREDRGYGSLGAHGLRDSGVCRKRRFTEYRQLNSDTPDEIDNLLVPALVRIFNENPPLPTIEKVVYQDPVSYRIASEFCCSLIGKTAEPWEISGTKSSSTKTSVISSSEFQQGITAEERFQVLAEVGHV